MPLADIADNTVNSGEADLSGRNPCFSITRAGEITARNSQQEQREAAVNGIKQPRPIAHHARPHNDCFPCRGRPGHPRSRGAARPGEGHGWRAKPGRGAEVVRKSACITAFAHFRGVTKQNLKFMRSTDFTMLQTRQSQSIEPAHCGDFRGRSAAASRPR
jgi:hypothetical protein